MAEQQPEALAPDVDPEEYARLEPSFRSEEEKEAFVAFSAAAAHLTEDKAVLLRFLRARRLDQAAALEQLEEAMKWRAEVGADTVLDKPAPKAALMKQLVPHAFLGTDKEGRPLYVERTGQIDVPRLLNLMNPSELELNHTAGYEHQLRRCRQNSVREGRLISDCCSIMDLNGLSMAAKKGMDALKAQSKTDERVYPETIGHIFVVNAPWIFGVLWKVVRHWMDDNTRAKIHILGGDYKERLLEYIDADQLPVEYGGTSDAVVPAAYEAADLSVEEYDPELTEEVVPAGGTFERSVPVEEGGTVTWFFRTAKKDIRFGVQWFADGKEAPEVVDPVSKRNSHEVRVEGAYLAHKPGRVVFTWDNSNSWMSSKTVRYSVGEADH